MTNHHVMLFNNKFNLNIHNIMKVLTKTITINQTIATICYKINNNNNNNLLTTTTTYHHNNSNITITMTKSKSYKLEILNYKHNSSN